MAKKLKSPGVYIEERNLFPASIAQVPTAIPAFVGFTEMDLQQAGPTKVRSLLDYQQGFGGAPEPENLTINIDKEDYQVSESKFKLYNSLQLFFANGGGQCYIVSIGTYSGIYWQDVTSGTFKSGINQLKKIDDVTLIAFPDAVNMTVTNLGQVQEHALAQCADLKDRFTILDVIQEERKDIDSNCANFRDATGNQNLKNGAAYYPFLRTSFGYKFKFKRIAEMVNFETVYPSDSNLLNSVQDFDKLYNDLHDSTGGMFFNWEKALISNPKVKVLEGESDVVVYFRRLWNLLAVLGRPDDFSHEKLKDLLKEAIAIEFKQCAQKLVNFKTAYEKLKKVDGEGNPVAVDPLGELDNDTGFKGPWKNIKGYSASDPNPFEKKEAINNPDGTPSYSKILAHLNILFDQIESSMNSFMTSIKDYELIEENNLTAQIPIYPKIIAGLSKAMNIVPPSGAIAGIYAMVDRTRGVWKAPANISLNGIMGLTDNITDQEQGNMNIHESGKSINAIRKFAGRGFLVWGARTLDGNNSDWRYVNVRRLAIMIEESVKKACMNFVFEPNVKQTWVNVKGMIENYLTTIWSDGALAGAKPEDAFFVSVGLNNTMTANDIINGRMIIKIAYAPSRPAEFIILQFTQQQQKS